MAENRYKYARWKICTDPDGTIPHADAVMAVQMDIRDELKELNLKMAKLLSIFQCQNFLDVPYKLDLISRNTAKPRTKK